MTACPRASHREVSKARQLAASSHRIELFRLSPYSPELNAIEGVWKVTKKTTTHNRFYRTTEARNLALASIFMNFNDYPHLIAGHVARFLCSNVYAFLFSVERVDNRSVPSMRAGRTGHPNLHSRRWSSKPQARRARNPQPLCLTPPP
jgi:hypothetical protein